MGFAKLSRISFLFAITIPSISASSLFRREDAVCGGIDNLVQCGNDLPSEFCCPKDTTCTKVNSTEAVSVICCPTGVDCSFIQPTTCDIGQFNAKLHPDNQIHLLNETAVRLPECGSKCCPLGYTCSSGMCQADLSNASPTTSPSASASSTPSPTESPAASQTTDAPPVVKTSSGFDGRSFAAGFFPGIVIGALGTIGLLWIIKKRRESNRYSGDFGHVSRQISDPIYDPNIAGRTDFSLRRRSEVAQQSPNSTTGMVAVEMVKSSPSQVGGVTPKIKSLWERTPKLGFGNGGWTGLPSNPAPRPPPPAVRAGNGDPYKTPERTPTRNSSITRTGSKSYATRYKPQRPLNARSSSTETIDVGLLNPSFLAPPKAPGMRENRMTQDSSNTTFTKLMERAGYDGQSRDDVRNWQDSPAQAR
jgi:hypothetical protein